MTPFSGSNLDFNLTAIREDIAGLVALCTANGYGIVSSVLESEYPTAITVGYNGSRVNVTPGMFVTPNGQTGFVRGSVTNLLWPDTDVLYVTVFCEESVRTSKDDYGVETWTTSSPTMFLDLLTGDQVQELGGAAVVVAVLSRLEGEHYVDLTQLTTSYNRVTWSLEDLEHRGMLNSAARHNNPHGTGLNQVSAGKYTVLAQMLDTGYVSSSSGTEPGVPGTWRTQTFKTEALPDSIGRVVAPGHYYLVLPTTPTATPVVAGREFTWESGSAVLDFGDADPGPVTVSWFSAPGCDAAGLLSSVLSVLPKGEATIVADGNIPDFDGGTFDTTKFNGMPSILDVYVDSDGKLVCAPDVIDTVVPATATAPTAPMPVDLAYPSQIGFRLRKSGLNTPLPPPLGTMVTASTDFVGRYRFTYTIAVPGGSETLALEDTGYGSYKAATSMWAPERLTIAGIPVGTSYWKARDGFVFLEARAFQAGTCSLARGDFESARFRGDYYEATGTLPQPEGVHAQASIVIRGVPGIGDSVSVFLSADNPTVTKVWETAQASTVAAAGWLAGQLNTDPLFADYCAASATASTVVLTSKKAGIEGNSYVLSVNMTSASTKVKVAGFTGGAPYTAQDTDVVGARLSIGLMQVGLPAGAAINVYATRNLDAGGKETEYRQVGSIPVQAGVFVYSHTVTAADVMALTRTYDTASKFQTTIQLTGSDPLGSNLVESITITDADIYESRTPGSEADTVYSKNVYSKITNYIVTNASNTGSAEVVLLSSALSKNSSRARIARLATDGSVISKITDTRLLQPELFTMAHEVQTDGLLASLAIQGL